MYAAESGLIDHRNKNSKTIPDDGFWRLLCPSPTNVSICVRRCLPSGGLTGLLSRFGWADELSHLYIWMACSFISGWGHNVHPNNPAVAWSSESYWNLPPIFLAMLCWRSATGVASRDVAPDRLQTVLHLLAASDCEGGGRGRRRSREEEEQHPLMQFHLCKIFYSFFLLSFDFCLSTQYRSYNHTEYNCWWKVFFLRKENVCTKIQIKLFFLMPQCHRI